MPQAPVGQRKRGKPATSNAPSMPTAMPEQSLEDAHKHKHSLSNEREALAPSKAVDEDSKKQGPIAISEPDADVVAAPVMITDTQIAPDYRPSARLALQAMADCGDEAVIEHELRMFIAHMQERGAFSANWDASWVKWWGRWKDRQAAVVAKSAKAPPRVNVNKQPEYADFESQVMRWKNNGIWSRHFGAEPGQPGCTCPPDILTRHGIDPATGRKLEKA